MSETQISDTNSCTQVGVQQNSIMFDVKKPVKSFTGRNKELQSLHSHVQRNRTTNEHKLTVVSGLAGVGKSELARMYVHQYSNDYDCNVLWINATTYGTLKESFHTLAKDKLKISTKGVDGKERDIDLIVQQVYKYFSKKKSLFIFDHADKLKSEKEGDDGIDRFLPNYLSPDGNEPYIIITSRNKEWGNEIKVLELDAFTEEEAIQFIKKELGISDNSQEKEIKQLATTLHDFPLALQQAIAYIKQTHEEAKNAQKEFQITDYLTEYEEKAKELIEFEFPEDKEDKSHSYTKTTFITWELTLEKLKENKFGEQALEVLETIAYLGPDNIPIKIFLEVVKGDMEKLRSILELPAQYSMIDLEPEVINIHKLVQHTMRLRLKDKDEKQRLTKTLQFIKSLIGEGSPESLEYLTHAISVWNHASNHDDSVLAKTLIEVSSDITHQLIDKMKYEDAYAFAIKTLQLLKGGSESDDPFSLSAKPKVLNHENIHEVLQDIHKEIEHVLGTEHCSTLLTKYSIAYILHQKRKYDDALSVYEEVLSAQQRVLGEEHPHTLTTTHGMASVLKKQGKHDEALGMYEQALSIKERVLGTEVHDTLATRHHMALVLEDQGKYDEALKIYEENLNIQERVLGAEHPSTLKTKHNIALVLDNQGKYEQALRLYQEVLEIRERVLGPEHPDTLATKHNLDWALDE